jgi:hypothetical protein
VECKKTHLTQFCHIYSDIKIVKQSNKIIIAASAIEVLLLNGFHRRRYRKCVFDAPSDMVWKIAEAHIKEGNKIHANTRNNKTEILNQTTFINSWKRDDDDNDANGQTIRMKARGSKYLNNG